MPEILGVKIGKNYDVGYADFNKGEKLSEKDFFPRLEKYTDEKRK